ncbi:MAG: ABC transporter ATP-binding protein [Nitrospira sp.]|nr:ABC transporter ATP-binding protein [bacterium]MBL7048884.1 ABC transporter ATP-binding protein [Nitrospira sp.]
MTLISAHNLSKKFSTPAQELNILKDISLDIQAGEMTAMMGPSGVGKSTLLHILGTLDRPTSGELLYEGRNVLQMKDDELAAFRSSSVGFVFQFHHLLPEFDALENVMMPALIGGRDRREARDKALELIADVGLTNRANHKPGQLSGGEKQRIAIARALMLDPKVVLADEPTGNLDTKTGEEIFKLMLALNRKGITFVMVTHNESLAGSCSRIVRIRDGIIE